MTTQAIETLPGSELLEWVKGHVPGINHPEDRGWFLVPPPPAASDSCVCLCPCGRHGPVTLTRFGCTDGQSHIWLGQCHWSGPGNSNIRCDKVVWAYRRADALRPNDRMS